MKNKVLLSFATVLSLASLTGCGCSEKHEHNFNIDGKDEVSHWKECSCGARDNNVNHTFVGKYDETSHWNECSACGYNSPKVTHTIEQKKDDNNHWTRCADCDYESTHQNHNFMPRNDDDKHWYECECGTIDGEGEHDLAIENDANGHWYICHACTYESEKANHEYENKNDASSHWKECACGNKTDLDTHDWEVIYDSNFHYTRCKECGRNDSVVGHKLVQKSNTEGHWKECSDCDYATELESHNYGYDYKYDETGHWQVCSCGAKTAVEGHQLKHDYNVDSHFDRCETCDYKTNVEAHCYEKYVELPETECHSVKCTGCDSSLCSQVHEFEDKYDDNNHWKECKDCHCVRDVHENSIEYKNIGVGHFAECSACDFGDTFSTYEDHDYQYKYSKYSHWLECKCGASEHTEDHALTYVYDSEGHIASCATCGYTSEKEEHDLVLKTNDNGHWYECVCGYKTDIAEHDYDYSDYDLSSHYDVCKTCGEYYNLQDHNFNIAKTDSTRHWKECECGAIDDLKTHTLVTEKDKDYHWEKCTGCSHTTSKVAHNLTLKGDKYGHWYECECGYKTDMVDHVFDYSDYVARTHFDVCAICGERYNQYAHSFNTYEHDDTQHWKVCKCGAEDDPEDHELTDVFDETGHWKRCTACGYTTEKIPYNS